jgi:hypothetical protein
MTRMEFVALMKQIQPAEGRERSMKHDDDAEDPLFSFHATAAPEVKQLLESVGERLRASGLGDIGSVMTGVAVGHLARRLGPEGAALLFSDWIAATVATGTTFAVEGVGVDTKPARKRRRS